LKQLLSTIILTLLALGSVGAPLVAQSNAESITKAVDELSKPSATDSASDAPLGLADVTGENGLQLSSAVEVALVLTVLSLLPAVLISLTCFTRIVIVLSFVRRALAVQELPPNPILIGLALFLTAFVMGPVFKNVYHNAYEPYQAGEIGVEEAGETAWGEVRGFLINNTRDDEMIMFMELAELEPPDGGRFQNEDLPFNVVVPAFVLSELKTAFQMGFLLFLPFLVIDLVVASVLISMGMFMLPPVMISTPFKILIFVLVDGWRLVSESLVTSFVL